MADGHGHIEAMKPLALLGDGYGRFRSDSIMDSKPIYSRVLYVAVSFLVIAGGFNLYSAAGGQGMFFSHMKQLVLAIVAFATLAFWVQPRHLRASTYWVYAALCVALVGVLVMGHIGWGARRWITIGPLTGQPSELAKIVVAMVVARHFTEISPLPSYRLRDLWVIFAMVGSLFLLIFPQPDLGTATFLILIMCVQLAFVPVAVKSLAIVGSAAAVILPLIWHFFLLPYQKMRVLSFLDPSYEPQGKGYNVMQSLIAIGSGGLDGKGFMNGTQTHLKFLPMSHSDFIFSVFAEEHGFWGASLVLIAFAVIGCVALLIARESKNTFSALLAIGLGGFLFVEFAINVAMVLRMFPVKGLPLPFFSAGGSNLIVSLAAVGILIAIDRDNHGKFESNNIRLYTGTLS